MEILFILLLAVATEAITEIITKRSIFEPIRNLTKEGSFLNSLFSCGACVSVWVSIILCYLTFITVGLISGSLVVIEPLILAFVVHRLATLFHQLYGAIKNGPLLNLSSMMNFNNLNKDVDKNE